DGDEAHHLRVKRVAPGGRVRLFDGRGREVAAALVSLGRDAAVLDVLEEEVRGAEPAVAIEVGLAIPKGKRAQVFLEKATELGVASIFPLVTRRTVGGAREAAAAVKGDKWRRTTIEAAKQSGVLRLPALGEPRAIEDVLRAPAPAPDSVPGAGGT